MTESQNLLSRVPVPLHSQHATSAHLTLLNADLLIVFASAMPHFEEKQGLVPGTTLEPVAAISLSTIAAKQLMRQLELALKEFERITQSTIPNVGEISEIKTEETTKS